MNNKNKKKDVQMARYRGPRLKIIRRIGENLPGLMYIDKTNIERNYPPGEHGLNKKGKPSDYQLHLNEKQKLIYHYGLVEKQLKKYCKSAFRSKENTGKLLLSTLERRLDNIVYRSTFFRSIKASRQAIVHKHILVNKKYINIPSYITKKDDIIEFRENSSIKNIIHLKQNIKHDIPVPSYLNLDLDKVSINIISDPLRKDVPININEQLVVEYYSGR